ncbi:MAG: alpha-galactosidase [Bacillota bacterium]|nr:alpha-galactosidase [Bacillota bacterium]
MAIRRLGDENTWVLETELTAYVLGVDKQGGLQHLYWGDRLPLDRDYPRPTLALFDSPFESPRSIVYEEYPAWGGIKFTEPCLKVCHADGVRTSALVYDFSEMSEGAIPELVIGLKDSQYGLVIRLHYKLYEEFDIIERYAEVANDGARAVIIEQILSAAWAFPKGTGYRLTYLAGRWGAETQVRRLSLEQGKFVLESRRGLTSPQVNPWFAIDGRERATEETGRVWYGALSWSGSWKIVVEQTSLGQLIVSGGINDFDFTWLLEPGEVFKTPVFVGGYTTGGFGAASRNMHGYQLKHVLPKAQGDGSRLRKVLFNSWEAVGFNVSTDSLATLAEKAASLGVELFVVDDGWFGSRNDDTAGLGDWRPSPRKFPNGLKPLIERVRDLGMEFGIWVEPEMVNPDSDLYRGHPDWVYNFPTMPRSQGRNQLVLNLSRNDVKEYIFHCLDRLLSDNDIAFVKWDANRHFSEPGWPESPEGREREVWVRHVLAVYDILDRLRQAHPQVAFESCSGGGGRVDLGILRRTDQVWPSDNTDPLDRLWIHEGFSYAYCPKVMSAWVTDSSRDCLAFGFHSAMAGSLGISANLNQWSPEELELARQKIAEYKEIRHIVQEGRLYRLTSPSGTGSNAGVSLSAVQYVSPDQDESVLFVFLLSRQFRTPIPRTMLRGLRPDCVYEVTGNGPHAEPVRLSGKALSSLGIEPALSASRDSLLVRIRRTDR